ncbi:hypothetical protein [Nocardia sp. MDA0666]|uniref:hypothetical protein n=1 Tax=Nocardia sp. MDA0666 TaxID=2135448 RepID=UPI0011B24CBB|nr:hypothetical protein [Nocardia sp. MDA0666]
MRITAYPESENQSVSEMGVGNVAASETSAKSRRVVGRGVRKPPGPPVVQGLASFFGAVYGAGYIVGGDRAGYAMVRRYGQLMSVPVLGFGDVVVVSDPELVRRVFTAKQWEYSASIFCSGSIELVLPSPSR